MDSGEFNDENVTDLVYNRNANLPCWDHRADFLPFSFTMETKSVEESHFFTKSPPTDTFLFLCGNRKFDFL